MNGCSLQLLDTGPEIRGAASFSPDFPGFDGHFPGDPILPGFYHIQLALQLLALATGTPHQLLRIEDAKFLRPIRPQDPLLLHLKPLHPGIYETRLFSNAELCSRFQFHVQPAKNPAKNP